MKSFHTIAVPHADILADRLTMDVWAADLWAVFKGRGADEYKDPNRFFEKTYRTKGLQNLLSVVERRLAGQGGDPVIQVQTPFGGGKTHSLIALYHTDFEAKKVVMVGTSMSTSQTPWGMLEEQLEGKVDRFSGMVAPGGEALQDLLSKHQPVLILMDEVLEYMTKAAGVKVEESTLAAQVLAFMQELTQVAGTLDHVSVLLTLPSSILEHYDEAAERLYAQLSHAVGRVEKIYTPVEENEISRIIRQRLFSTVDKDTATGVIQLFMRYAERENLLPPGTEPSEYRKRFEASYPFLPEVIDVLYHRWGSFPSFQRTRGVLRLLSLVIHSLKTSNAAYVGLADFNLAEPELRRDLLKHIGLEYDSVVASDLTSPESGAKKTDTSLGDSYKGLSLGSRAATTIFLYSFSGGLENGATLGEIKRSATTLSNPSSVIAEALDKLRDSLFFLQHDGGRYAFTNQPNLNRILLTRMENVSERELFEEETERLRKCLSGRKLKTIPLFSMRGDEVPDTPELKLAVVTARDDSVVRDIFEKKGSTPRVYRNATFVLAPVDSERAGFHNQLRRMIAYRQVLADRSLNLSEEQTREAKADLKKTESGINDTLRRYYRLILLPGKDGTNETELGIPTFGDVKPIDEEVYDKLRSNNEILERIAPLVIKEKYLKSGDGFVFTEQLVQSSLKTPGEPRPLSIEVWERGIADGVRQGLFGLGELEKGEIRCHFFKKEPSLAFSGAEILIRDDLCKQERLEEEKLPKPEQPTQPVIKGPEEETQESKRRVKQQLDLRFNLPKGKVSSLMGVLNLLQSKYRSLHIQIHCENGEMTEDEYEDKIKEAFMQMGVKLE